MAPPTTTILQRFPASVYTNTILCVIVVAIVVERFLVYWRLRAFKGPWIAGFSKLWMARSTLSGRMHLDVEDVCRKFGRVARIGPNDLVTSDPELLRRISSVRSPYTRSGWYDSTAFDHSINHVFCERDEARHLDLRAKMAAGYAGKENPHLEPTIDAQILAYHSLLTSKYLSTPSSYRTVDFARVTQYLALDIISAIAFAEPFGFLKEDRDVYEYIGMQRKLLPVFEWFSTLPGLNWWVRRKWVSRAVMPTPKDSTGVGRLMGVAKQIVAKRFGPEKETREDMLGSFIGHGLTQREAEIEAVLQVMAGSDTTVTAIRATTLFIITHPPTYATLQHELATATLSGPIISASEASELPFLQGCIREGLRLWPPVMGLNAKTAPPEGDSLNDGRWIPGRTNVGYCAWGVMRDKEVFGEDADAWRPERWLIGKGTGDEESVARMRSIGDLVFGSGRYGCLGKPIALLELGKVVAELFRRYDIALVDPTSPAWKSVNRNGLFLQSEMWLKISERRED